MPLPVQVPMFAVSMEARWTWPESVGRTVFTGGALVTFAVAVLEAVAVASGLVTVTSSRR